MPGTRHSFGVAVTLALALLCACRAGQSSSRKRGDSLTKEPAAAKSQPVWNIPGPARDKPERTPGEVASVALIYPRDQDQRIDERVTLFWSQAPAGPAAQPASFELDFDGTIERVGNRTSVDKRLRHAMHYWRVRRLDPAGNPLGWSEARSLELVKPAPAPDNQRTALFDELVARIQRRDAAAPKKWARLGTSFEQELARQGLRQAFSYARSEHKLMGALLKLNNARRDRHLVLKRATDAKLSHAPLRFYPDLGDLERPRYFVGRLTKTALEKQVQLRDRLIAINNVPVAEYLRKLAPYIAHSTRLNLWTRHAARYLTAKNSVFGRRLYAPNNEVHHTLEHQTTGRWYRVSFEYGERSAFEWLQPHVLAWNREQNPKAAAHFAKQYKGVGFARVFDDGQNCALYLRRKDRLALIEWYAFKDTQKGVDGLLAAARRHGAIGYDVIVDTTHSAGGQKSALLLQVLAKTGFKTTFGDLRVEDREFVERHLDRYPEAVQAWARKAMREGRAYAPPIPYKLHHLGVDSDGVMQPKRGFSGRCAVLLFPLRGSSVDQFASMIIDNPQLGIHTLGMPTGGFSKSWLWADEIPLPRSGKLQIEHSVGRTFRPNGEILEGNPPEPAERIPFTRDNFDRYFPELIERAASWLKAQRSERSDARTR